MCRSNSTGLTKMPMVTIHVRFNATTGGCTVRTVRAEIGFLPSVCTDMFLEVVAVSTGASTIRTRGLQELAINGCWWYSTDTHTSLVVRLERDKARYHHLLDHLPSHRFINTFQHVNDILFFYGTKISHRDRDYTWCSFSTWCLLTWDLRWEQWLALYGQYGHWKGLSPVWIRTCVTRLNFLMNALPQKRQVWPSPDPSHSGHGGVAPTSSDCLPRP